MPAYSGRRRRMLSEERHNTIELSPADVSLETTKAPRYTEAANIENHPQVSDLIGRRYRSYVVGIVAGIGCIGILLAGHSANGRIAAALGQPRLPALELGERGSLAAWCVSLVLALISPLCLLIYSLRRHRIDDYHARYRVWLGAAATALLASGAVATKIHVTFAEAMSTLTGWSPAGQSALWSLALAAVLGGWLSFRLTREIRECRPAVASFLLGLALSLVALATGLGWVPWVSPAQTVPVLWGTGMLAVLSCGLALNVFARFVILDVQGLIEHRTGKRVAPRIDVLSLDSGQNANSAASPHDASDDAELASSPPTTAWIDGTQGSDDDEEEERRYEKRQHKKSRRQSSRRRAA